MVLLLGEFQYIKNCRTMNPFRATLMMKVNWNKKSLVSYSTVSNLAAEPAKDRKNVKKAS